MTTMAWLRRSFNKDSYTRLAPPVLRVFQYAELKKATRNFHYGHHIGKDTFKGTMKIEQSNGRKREVNVVIKNFSEGMRAKDVARWLEEIKNLEDVVSHPNLVKIIGYCAEINPYSRLDEAHCLLVYEHVKNGSVHDRLIYSESEKPLAWERRVKIAREAARALGFLHENYIMYEVFKSEHVLLDEKFNVKLCYYILPKLDSKPTFYDRESTLGCSDLRDIATCNSRAPEVYNSHCLTDKNDVWGFGIFLCELIRGCYYRGKQRGSIFEEKIELEKIMDSRLQDRFFDPVGAKKLISVARMCLRNDPEDRPSMKRVVEIMNEVQCCRIAYSDKEFDLFSH